MSRLLTPVLMCTGAEKENEEERLDNQPKLPWEGSDRDYTYQELLGTYAAQQITACQQLLDTSCIARNARM